MIEGINWLIETICVKESALILGHSIINKIDVHLFPNWINYKLSVKTVSHRHKSILN